MDSKDERWAVFWCTLLAEIIFGDVEPAQVHQHLKQLSQQEHLFPTGERKRPSLSTLKRKLARYQKHGLEGLARKERSDRGRARSVSGQIIEKAVEIKKDQPKRSAATINRFLKHYYDTTIPRSTLYRHLKQHGATRLKLGVVQKKVRSRWTREHPNDLWIGDFSHGPYVLLRGEVVPTYLCLFIDCCSRYVVEGRYYLRQTLDILIDALIRAWMIHGLSNDMYLDQAKVFLSHALKAACFDLRIRLIHRARGDPSPGGLVERIFGTNQQQFEAEVRAGDILPFEELNRAFSAYLNVVYHETVHSEIGQTPRSRFQESDRICRPVDIDKAVKFFMKKETRTVNADFSDVAIQARFFKVDPKFRGDKVLVRYDPFSEMDKVHVYSLDEQFLTTAPLYHREKGAHPETSPTALPKPKHNYIDMILTENEKHLNAQAKGIDYVKLLDRKRWPFMPFVHEVASLMGRKSTLTDFSAQELETLKKLYDKHPDLNVHLLRSACEHAQTRSIGQIALALQKIKQRKE